MPAQASIHFTAGRLAHLVGEQLGPVEIIEFFKELSVVLRTRVHYAGDEKLTQEMEHLCKKLQVNGAKAAKRVRYSV